jgi:RNA polymerase sigma factor for flagellar operon FliA
MFAASYAIPAIARQPATEPSSDEPIRVEDHLYLVRKVAERMARRLPPVVDINDLIGAGTLGLIDAADKYDPARCDRFAGYAEIRIRGAILDELRTMDWVPRSVRNKGHRLSDALATLSQSLGRAPDESEMAEYLGVSAKTYDDMCRDVRNIAIVSAEDLTGEGMARFADELETQPHHEVDAKEMRERVASAVAKLPERERQVLSLYYVEELRLKEIGEIFGVTESRVCQIHTQAVARLRKIVEAEETI